MVIKLLAGRRSRAWRAPGPNIAGIESFELRHVERLHLDLGQAMAAARSANAGERAGGDQLPRPVPFRRGRPRGDVSRQRRRDESRTLPGPADQIACDVLSLYFTDRTKEQECRNIPMPPARSTWSPERIVADGNPAVVTAPSQDVSAQAERLEYNLLTNSITLGDGQEVVLQHGPDEIHARSLSYQAAGRVDWDYWTSQGPGWLRGHLPISPISNSKPSGRNIAN